MTNKIEYLPVSYGCNGIATKFSFPWKILNQDDLIIQIKDSEGNFQTLERAKDYNVRFEAMGGEIETLSVYPIGSSIIISRNVSNFQDKSFSTSPGFQGSEIEKSLDSISCNLQEQDYNIENFKETFSAQIEGEIDELENTIEENKQEVLLIQERFENEVNIKIQEVSDAAGKINALEQAVIDAENSASIATLKSQEVIETGEQLIQDITKEVVRVEDVVDELDKNIDKIINHVTFNLFDTKISDHILTGCEAKGWALQGTYVDKAIYPDFYNKCLEQKTSATETSVTLGSSTLTMFVNENGHQFYNIADKSSIDTFYDTYGIADFYGIDEENERVFLPRNKYFHQLTDDISKVNEMVEAGLPNITAYSPQVMYNKTIDGAFFQGEAKDTSTLTSGVGDSSKGGTLQFDASLSNSIYGNSHTVQPPSSLKLLYYCVGNTEVKNATTNVTEITESKNDSNPLGSSFYFNNIQPNVGWLKSSGQWNDGNIYATFYSWLVDEYINNSLRTDIKDVTQEYTDYDYVLNQDEMLFRLPLLNGSEDLPSDKYDELELLASGATYKAPANGLVTLVKDASGTNQDIAMFNNNVGTRIFANVSGDRLSCFIPVNKEDTFSVSYSAGGTTVKFRFYYAQGNGSLYFKVANAVQNLELLNAGEVLEAVNNVVPNNSSLIAGYSMPDYSAGVSITLSTSDFIIPFKGVIMGGSTPKAGDVEQIIYVNGHIAFQTLPRSSVSASSAVYIPVEKGDVVKTLSAPSSNDVLILYPLKGAN